MAAPRVLLDEAEVRTVHLPASPDFGWRLFGILGGAFVLVGLLDIALAWYPFHFGNPEWEFGTVSSTLDSLPVTVFGFGLLLGGAVARGWRNRVRIWAILLIVLAVLIIAMAVMYALDVPVAFRAVHEPLLRTGLKKAVTKAVGEAIIYPVALIVMGVKALKFTKLTR
jgi:hypothetical protein